jgi:hypothetical protein
MEIGALLCCIFMIVISSRCREQNLPFANGRILCEEMTSYQILHQLPEEPPCLFFDLFHMI